MNRAFLGLGTNLGDRERNLASALDALRNNPRFEVVSFSSIYRSEPIGVEDQPEFLNAVVEIKTGLAPDQLLETVKAMELDLGREPTFRWGPRIIDIDILLYENQIIKTENLVIPHPELPNRLFALMPLEEILGPFAPIPGFGGLGALLAKAQKNHKGYCEKTNKLLD